MCLSSFFVSACCAVHNPGQGLHRWKLVKRTEREDKLDFLLLTEPTSLTDFTKKCEQYFVRIDLYKDLRALELPPAQTSQMKANTILTAQIKLPSDQTQIRWISKVLCARTDLVWTYHVRSTLVRAGVTSVWDLNLCRLLITEVVIYVNSKFSWKTTKIPKADIFHNNFFQNCCIYSKKFFLIGNLDKLENYSDMDKISKKQWIKVFKTFIWKVRWSRNS